MDTRIEESTIDRDPLSSGDLSLTLYSEKIDGQGEDAEPILRNDADLAMLGVFDGMGGAGSTRYQLDNDSHSGAYFASRAVRDTVQCYFDRLLRETTDPEEPFPSEDFVAKLKEDIEIELENLSANLQAETASRIKSNLIKRFPTTMACLFVSSKAEDRCTSTAVWAGDSRCYHLSPKEGLLQLTRDDLVTDADPYSNLKNDAPISNCINADTDFTLSTMTFSFDKPCILLSATDGCFGYWATPMHFEHLLLDSLSESSDMHEWRGRLTSSLSKVSADDFSMSLIAIGWSEFTDLRTAFSRRFRLLNEDFIEPCERIRRVRSEIEITIETLRERLEDIRQQESDMERQLWDIYRQSYLRSQSAKRNSTDGIQSCEGPDHEER